MTWHWIFKVASEVEVIGWKPQKQQNGKQTEGTHRSPAGDSTFVGVTRRKPCAPRTTFASCAVCLSDYVGLVDLGSWHVFGIKFGLADVIEGFYLSSQQTAPGARVRAWDPLISIQFEKLCGVW